MAAHNDTASMALFCDFENIALGVRDAQYEKFDIRPVLERLLAKGSIVVKKAYCDWERYKGFKATMHEANFELIEIPHVRQSGKNSADIRLVVDALDLCYTKSHVDTFVIISGDSDFSPLVSKLRENAKQVIGVGVKQSTSDLLIANCDEFIYYDDLVRDREQERSANRRENRDNTPRRTPEEEQRRREKSEARKLKAIEIAVSTFNDLIAVRGESERIWASVLKEVVKRRNPGFNESYYGFRSFGNLLEEAASRGLIGFGRDEKSGAFVMRPPARVQEAAAVPEGVEGQGDLAALPEADVPTVLASEAEAAEAAAQSGTGNRRSRGRRGGRRHGGSGEGAESTDGLAPLAATPAGAGLEKLAAAGSVGEMPGPVVENADPTIAGAAASDTPLAAGEGQTRGRRGRGRTAKAAAATPDGTAAEAGQSAPAQVAATLPASQGTSPERAPEAAARQVAGKGRGRGKGKASDQPASAADGSVPVIAPGESAKPAEKAEKTSAAVRRARTPKPGADASPLVDAVPGTAGGDTTPAKQPARARPVRRSKAKESGPAA